MSNSRAVWWLLIGVTAVALVWQGRKVFDWLARVPDELRPIFERATAQYGLPAHLLEAVGYRESRFSPDIIDGTVRSTAGAVGVMQIRPAAHPELGEAGAADPARAIPYAAGYFVQLKRQFGTWPLAVAAYNWGPGNLSRNLARGVDAWPAETRAYVAEVIGNAGLS